MRGTALLIFAGISAASIPLRAAGAVAPGVSNFHQVDERIYRGGQPKGAGWDSLAALGIKTVIDLLEHSPKAERRAVEAAGMQYLNVRLSGVRAASNRKISNVLALLNGAAGPVFVHCRRGADRTGEVIACYRIAHDGWSNRKALQEATSYGMRWINIGMRRYVLAFQPAGAPPGPSPIGTLN